MFRPLAYTLYTRWIGLILSSWCHGQVISGEIELHSETTVAINKQIINNLPNNTDILTGDYLVLCLTSGLVNGNKLRLVFRTVYVLPDLIFTHFPGRGAICQANCTERAGEWSAVGLLTIRKDSTLPSLHWFLQLSRVHSVIRSLFLPCSRLFCSYLSFMSCRVLSCYYLSVTLIGKRKWDDIIFLSFLPLNRHLAVYTVS